MARSKTIREDIQPYIDNLVAIYEETNPELGEVSEETKLENISLATDMWWKLFGDLMGWAQSHLVGYSILQENPEYMAILEKVLGESIHNSSHILEHYGWTYTWNRPCGPSQSQDAMDMLLDELREDETFPEGLNDAAMRTMLTEILMSKSGTSSFWRMPFQNSFQALNHGELDRLATPVDERKQGQPYKLRTWKIRAVSQVNFMIGKGYKKYKALEKIGNEIGQSPETLRSWEKQIVATDPDGEIQLFASKVAGELYLELKSKKWRKELDLYIHGSFRGVSLIEHAHFHLHELEKEDFAKIKNGLRSSREKI